MPQLLISRCSEILEDPSLQWWFPEEKWRSFHKLPFLGTLQFWMVSERLFTHLSSPSVWGQARLEFFTGGGWKISGEIVPKAVLITNGVEEGSLGMVTTFCCHDQVKVEPSGVLSTLHQWDSPKLSIVVVKIFDNSPYLPRGSSSFLYLDIPTLSLGTLTAQFPLYWLCLWQLLPYSPKQVILLCEVEDKELKLYPILQEALWESSEEDHCLLDPVLLSVTSSPFFLHQQESSQTEEGPSLRPALVQLQSVTQARAQLEWELAYEWEGLARKYEDQQTKLATKHEHQRATMAAKHEEWWARMGEEVDTTFWKVFSETSSIDSVRLLPWCVSGALLACYKSEALATTVQQKVEAPMAANTPESWGPQALVSTSSPVCQMETLPLPILPLSNIPLIGTPPVGHSPVRFLTDPQYTQLDCSPTSAPSDHPGKRAHTKPAEAEVSSGHSTSQGDRELPRTPLEVPNNGMGASGRTEGQTARMTLIKVVMSQPMTNWGRTQPTLIWNWPQGIVSLVQIWRRWLSKLHERDSRRGCRPPVTLSGAVFGLMPKQGK